MQVHVSELHNVLISNLEPDHEEVGVGGELRAQHDQEAQSPPDNGPPNAQHALRDRHLHPLAHHDRHTHKAEEWVILAHPLIVF